MPDFGRGKSTEGATVTVRVEQAAGSSVPAGASTAGSVVEVVEKDAAGAVLSSDTCTTVADPAPSNGSACAENFEVDPDATITLTQTSAAPHFVSAPSLTAGPYSCYNPIDGCPDLLLVTETLFDAGLPPAVTAASRTVAVPAGEATNVDVDEQQIDTDAAPPTAVNVTTQPSHGTVSVVSDAPPRQARAATPVGGAFHFVYTSAGNYIGSDSFAYTVSTANGTSATAVVNLKVVGAAPTASNDNGATTEGDSVRIAVLSNDDSNGGGRARITAVDDPRHGTARISGRTIVYTPADGFTGTEKFSYTITSYSGTDTATVTVRVRAEDTGGDDGNGTGGETDGADTNGSEVSTADTGVPSAALLEIGGALLLAGAGATVIGRRRRHA